jgi:uncharacterized protein (DUF1015 family)
MAEIIPFRALRYSPQVVPDLAAVVTPPYDVISPAARERFLARHPHNFVRLILPPSDPEAAARGERYATASRTWAAWRRDGILRRDPAPAVYLYQQTFSLGGAQRSRRGLLAPVRLHPYADRVIYPHERTFARVKDDRLALMRACPANLEAILGFAPGPNPAVTEILDRHAETAPVVHVLDEDGVSHRLWVAEAPAEIASLQAALRDRPIVIADGHHRYETALNFRNERRAALAHPPETDHPSPEDHVLMHVVHEDDPGLVILPTHRLIRRPTRSGEAVIAALGAVFRIDRRPLSADQPLASLRQGLADLAGRRGGGIACALYAGGSELLILELADPAARQTLLAEGHAPSYANLDVAVLHRALIEKILGMPPGGPTDDSLQYTRDESAALDAVREGAAHLALFLNPPRVEEVRAVAMAGERMPQKSTYFYPKVLSGLVINPLDGDAPATRVP